MSRINSLRAFVKRLDGREFFIYSMAYLGLSLFALSVIIVRHVYLSRDAVENYQKLNKTRVTVQSILSKFSNVEKQREKVDAILKKDKNFYIQKFFHDLLQKNKNNAHSTDKLSKQKQDNGYTEESLAINLTQITTKQLCEILKDIEDEDRVYIKNVDITGMAAAKKINVSMNIATLIPKAD